MKLFSLRCLIVTWCNWLQLMGKRKFVVVLLERYWYSVRNNDAYPDDVTSFCLSLIMIELTGSRCVGKEVLARMYTNTR